MANPISVTAYIVNPQWIIDNFDVASNLQQEDLKPSILRAQNTHLPNILGGKLYQKLMDDISAGGATGNYEILRSALQTGIGYATLSMALPWLNWKIRPKGVMQGTADNATGADLKTINMLRTELDNQTEIELGYVRQWLILNSNLFPEYVQNNEPPYPDYDDREWTSGMFFGKGRGRTFNQIIKREFFGK